MSVLEEAIAPRSRQTYNALRTRIDALACGVPLPSIAQLRSELKVGQATVEKALDLLDRQGFILRKPRKGVFVADRLSTGEIAIVLNRQLVEPNASRVYTLACSRLSKHLVVLNPKWAVKLHLGADDIPRKGLADTLDLLDSTVLPRLRGVISFHDLEQLGSILANDGVPVLHMGSGVAPWGPGVFLDGEQMLRDGIRHLAEKGCRNVALLNRRTPGKRECYQTIPVPTSFAADCGLQFREISIRLNTSDSHERGGFDLFMQVWGQPNRPDGIMVADDILCHGVLRAIQSLHLDLPRDLRLVSQASRGLDFPSAQSITRVEFDVNAWADTAVRMLEAMCRRHAATPRVERIAAVLIQGETT